LSAADEPPLLLRASPRSERRTGFDCARPDTLVGALALLAGGDGEAKAFRRRAEPGADANMRLARPAVLVDLNGVPGLLRQEFPH